MWEFAMRAKGVGWILRLAGDRQVESRSDAMEVDQQQTKPAATSIATLPAGSTVQPKQIVDLESTAFAQGGHLMSNKKCKLPEGSFKRTKKSYEEVHIPAPKKMLATEGEFRHHCHRWQQGHCCPCCGRPCLMPPPQFCSMQLSPPLLLPPLCQCRPALCCHRPALCCRRPAQWCRHRRSVNAALLCAAAALLDATVTPIAAAIAALPDAAAALSKPPSLSLPPSLSMPPCSVPPPPPPPCSMQLSPQPLLLSPLCLSSDSSRNSDGGSDRAAAIMATATATPKPIGSVRSHASGLGQRAVAVAVLASLLTVVLQDMARARLSTSPTSTIQAPPLMDKLMHADLMKKAP